MPSRKLFLVSSMSFFVAFATACQTETLVTKVDPNKPGTQRTDGVLFSLPETVVVAEVPLTKTESSPGVFHDWTEFFYPELTSDDYATEEKTSFKVGTPMFSTRGQTDPNNVYIAHIKAKQFETKTLLLELNEDGIIVREEASSKDETIDIITSGIKTAASIVAPLLPIGAGAAPALRTSDKSGGSYEDHFKKQLSERELSLYDSLDDDYIKFLRNNFGYDFLAYLAKKDSVGSTVRSANIEFFFTLNKKQKEFIEMQPRSNSKCVEGDAGTRCLAMEVKIELAKAKAAHNKIQELRQKREDLVATDTPPAVTTSTNLELKLKEIDAQIKATEETYFLGRSPETSATAKFEFKPTTGVLSQNFFTYAAGGSKPGICEGGVSSETGNFKAIWPQKLGGAACRAPGSYTFELGDFRDLRELAAKLNPPAAGVPDPVSAYLYSQLTAPTRGWLAAPFSTPQTKNRLLTALKTDLNQVLVGPSLYGLANFDQVKLSAATLELLGIAAPTPAQLIQLNRSLIEDAYPNEIYRQKAWVSHQVSLSVDAPSAGFAATVQAAQLSEPGKRGFPYRVAAATLAKLLIDGKETGRSGVRIAQFGPVQTLPAGLGGRRASYKITYYDATGAIKLFDMSADALIQKQNITDLTDAATTLRDAQAAKLRRENDLLELKKKKLDDEKALKAAQAEASPTP